MTHPLVTRGVSLPAITAIALAVIAAGCDVAIVHDLDEGQANEIIEAFDGQGVRAAKKRVTLGSRSVYTLTVARGDAPRAWRVLRERNLPRRDQPGLAEVFGDVGLVPTATQERAMLHQAVAGELSKTLESVEGVREARVHVVLPRRDALSPPDAPTSQPRASVLLKVGRASPLDKGQVQRLVAGSIDGLSPDRVNVVLARSQAPAARSSDVALATVGPFTVAAASKGLLVTTLVLAVLLVVGLAFGLLVVVRRGRAARLSAAASTPDTYPDLDASMSLLSRSIAGRSRGTRQPRQP